MPMRFFLSTGHALYVGPSHDPRFHQHYAVQFVAGVDAPLKIHTDAATTTSTRVVAIASEVRHRVLSRGTIALLFVEPEALGGPSWRAGSAEPVRYHHADRRALRGLVDAGPNAIREQLLGYFGVDAPVHSPADARLRELMRQIGAEGPMGLHSAAAHVHLSPSRLRHLFREQIGITWSRYLLWERNKRAVRHALQGATLTAAAHAAGFSDSAHFTRSFVNLFGLTPSTILQSKGAVHIDSVSQP